MVRSSSRSSTEERLSTSEEKSRKMDGKSEERWSHATLACRGLSGCVSIVAASSRRIDDERRSEGAEPILIFYVRLNEPISFAQIYHRCTSSIHCAWLGRKLDGFKTQTFSESLLVTRESAVLSSSTSFDSLSPGSPLRRTVNRECISHKINFQ